MPNINRAIPEQKICNACINEFYKHKNIGIENDVKKPVDGFQDINDIDNIVSKEKVLE